MASMGKAYEKHLECLLWDFFGKKGHLLSCEKINRKAEVHVNRVRIQFSNSAIQSIIAKYMPLVHNDSFQESTICHPSLQNEQVAYQFLMSRRFHFPFFPRMLGSRDKLLLLEDLEKNQSHFAQESEAQQVLITTLARLHAATVGQQSSFDDVKKTVKPSKGYHRLSCHDLETHFTYGIDYTKHSMSLFSIAYKRLHAELLKVQSMVQNPGIFCTFIHNDLVPGRQSIIRDGQFFFIDFEHSLFSHALLDFWRLYVGKVEYNSFKNYFFRKYFVYMPAAVTWYKKAFEHFSGQKINPEQWDHHFCGVLLYLTLSIIGLLIKMPSYVKELQLSLRPTLPLIVDVERLLRFSVAFLHNKSCFRTVYLAFKQWLEKLLQLRKFHQGSVYTFPEPG